MQVIFDKGLHLPALDLWMDARRRRAGCWVSHGHSDHIAPHQRFLATGPTAAFLQFRHARSQAMVVGYGEPITGHGCRITLYPAGHCLGAAQLLIELDDGHRVVYTGDFKLRPNPTAETCPIVPCDTLIMESTFGHPRYTFPTQDEVLDMVFGFVNRCFEMEETPVLLAYALGKSQEALHHLLEAGYRVRYHPQIAPGVAEYERWDVRFNGDHGPLSYGLDRETVVISPPGRHLRDVYQYAPGRVRTAFLTGWAVDEGAPYRLRSHEAFPLSDHADYRELLRYALESGAREVYTVNGLPWLAEELRGRGITARHLAQVAGPVQLSLPL